MMMDKRLSRKAFSIAIALVAFALPSIQCQLFGPEPGEPVFPAPIDPGDSAAVRAILDSNNLRSTSVRRAIDLFSQGRVTTLRFDSLGLDSFTFSSDFQKLDSLIGVDLTDNKITSIDVPDSLTYSRAIVGIDLQRNLLTDFPISLLKIGGLLGVDVSYNKITTISNELMASGFRQIGLDHNKLCSVSDTVKTWLDSLESNWANFQDCP